MDRPVVAIIGGRTADLAIEREVLEPAGATLQPGPGDTPAAIVEVAADADAILAGAAPRFTDEVLGQLSSCRGIVRYGVGTDSIDLAAAKRHGIQVANVPDYGTEAVSIHAVTLALAGIRRLHEADRIVRTGTWNYDHLRPLQLPSSMTAGVVGLGRIGMRTARALAALGFRVLGFDAFAPAPDPDSGVHAASFDEVLTEADVLTLHVPAPSDGGPLLGADELARLKRGSVLVNTARGRLIDQDALVDAMQDERPRIAALDVFPIEPPDLDAFEPVLDRMILSPHMAWYTEGSEQDLRRKAAAEVLRLLEGEPLLHPVDAVG